MSEQRGFTCDGGCGTTVVTQPHESIMSRGWYEMFGPHGFGTKHTCSIECMMRAIGRPFTSGLVRSA